MARGGYPPSEEQRRERGWTQDWDKWRCRESTARARPQHDDGHALAAARYTRRCHTPQTLPSGGVIEYFDFSGGALVVAAREAARREEEEAEQRMLKGALALRRSGAGCAAAAAPPTPTAAPSDSVSHPAPPARSRVRLMPPPQVWQRSSARRRRRLRRRPCTSRMCSRPRSSATAPASR